MRTLSVLFALAAAAACTTRPVKGVCCVTDADCAYLGVDEPRPCELGQACKAFHCVAAECSTSAECTSPDAPVCVRNVCVASCEADADCAGAAGGPICAEDGACVGCLTDAGCSPDAPFCDAEDRRCRGCEADAECASGVCIEADGVCADPGQIVYVQMFGSDVGECTSTAPCRTVSYALQKVTPSRKVVRISGGSFGEPGTIAIDRSVVIDASDTNIAKPGNAPSFSVGAALGQVTLEGVRLLGSSSQSDPSITVATGTTLRVVRSSLTESIVEVVNGGLSLHEVTVASSLETLRAIMCSNGTVSARQVTFEHTTMGAMNCQLNVSRCRFDEIVDGSIAAQGGVAVIENNLIIQAYELADTMILTNMAPGSTVRFNTFVNTSGVASDGVALSCDGSPNVTSNIFAYGSMHPHGTSTCSARYSLYDAIALPEQTAGTGNRVADGATFFANKAGRDFHLAPGSPARGAAEPGTGVVRDFEGRVRPSPSGSAPDMGAFEAP